MIEVILVPTLLVKVSLAFILFSTSVTFELNVVVCKYEVKLDLVANPLTSVFFSAPSILHHLFLLTSAVSLVFKTKLLVSTALSFLISAKLSNVFLVTPVI